MLYDKSLYKSILNIAVPISLQSLFQSSLSMIDQVMVGQLGTNSIAGIGLGSKFPFLFTTTLAAVGTSASIMISQYCGAQNKRGVNSSFIANGYLGLIITGIFFFMSFLFPAQILACYTTDNNVAGIGAEYLRIVAVGYIPLLITTMLSSMLRNIGHAKAPMIASIISVLINTFLNYVLIFGNFGAPKLGVNGTAIATTAARFIETFILLTLFVKTQKESIYKIEFKSELPNGFIKKTLIIASPIALNEFLWGFGDSMYSVVYGHIGAAAAAAMSLTSPVQNLSVGLFTGVSTAAAILVGNKLGKGEYDSAYKLSLKYMKLSVIGSIGMGGVVSIFAWVYSGLFKVPVSTRHTTVILLYIFSAYLFVKVSNMVLSGGIIRSGGKTNYTLYMDIFGTWIIGVPIGFLSAFVLHLPIEWVYSLITTEEVVRLIIGVFIFKSKKWMRQISKGTGDKNSYEAA